MDNRPPLSAPRPQAPKRAVSGSILYAHKFQGRPSLPSRLSTVRSVSQPANVVDLTAESTKGNEANNAAFLGNQGSVISSPEVIDADGEDEEAAPPAKRAKTSGAGFRAEESPVEMAHDAAYQTRPGSPLPAPPRPGPAAKVARVQSGPQRAARKADGIEPPKVATRLPPPKNVADFSPWTGKHPEDIMNETAVKLGYSDKGPSANQTESNSAKLSIWPNLSQKNNMGLQTLSWLFTSVLEKRQNLGKCTAPSTFKPPPRVTVTDTKREAWLRDLANPGVNLRKQSRSIPHGIRGKLLMDQCVSKNIPIQRAVWLAKCIGANELRAFRRKGVSGAAAIAGESKWVREWTMHIEQFLEGVIASCGQPEWRKKMNYAAKLAAAFYTEKLVDVEHYLDWIVTSFAEASLERLPIWILMIQMYWKDTTRFVRRGRQLAEGVLGQLHGFSRDSSDIHATIKVQLQRLLAVLAVTRRGCLVMPRAWHKYKYLLTPVTPTGPSAGQTAAQDIRKRNERLANPKSGVEGASSSLLELYATLDSFTLDLDVDKLAEAILTIVPHISALIPALLDWASSPYRQGLARTYLTARLIGNLRSKGHDIDSAVLNSLSSMAKFTTAQLERTHKVIAELVATDGFSLGRYMQWLITSGALSDLEQSTRAAELLAVLPCAGLPIHVQNTKTSLLRRLGAASHDRDAAEEMIAELEAQLQQPTNATSRRRTAGVTLTLRSKCIVGERIRSVIPVYAKQAALTHARFCLLRDATEGIQDVPCLIDLLNACLETEDATLLASVVDTINMNADSLAALGQLSQLCDRAAEQYRHLRSQQPLDRALIIALTGLAKRTGRSSTLTQLLSNDLAICEQQISLVVCSPASDSLMGMQASSLDTDDDIDAVFASGNVMDEMLMQRVFGRVVQRATMPRASEEHHAGKFCIWLHQLRSVGGSGFDQLAHNYIHSFFTSVRDDSMKTGAITALVASGCIGLEGVAVAAKESSTPSAALGALRLLVASRTSDWQLTAVEQYRYRLLQTGFQSSNLAILAELLCNASDSLAFDPQDVAIGDLIITLTSHEPERLKQMVQAHCTTSTSTANVAKVARALLKRGIPTASLDTTLTPKVMINSAGPLSVRYCACALEYTIRECGNQGSKADEVMRELIIDAIVNGTSVWPVLLDVANLNTKRRLHDWAQNQLLHASGRVRDCEEADLQAVISRNLAVLGATFEYVKDDDDHAVIAILAERLREYALQLEDPKATVADRDNTWSQSLILDILLHLGVLHAQTQPAETDAARQSRGNLLGALCALLENPKVQVQGGLSDYISDLASTLADHLSPSMLSAMARLGRHSDPRVQAILGDSCTSSTTWLALSSSQTQPAGGSQQQRALNKHASSQQTQPLPPPPPQHTSGRAGPHGQVAVSSTPPQRALPRNNQETKTVPYPLRTWEVMPDPTPVMGENDASLSLRLFGARKV